MNISQQSNDLSLCYYNPSLQTAAMSGQWQASFTTLGGGIRNYHLLAGYQAEKLASQFHVGINYFNYGNIAQTDAGGNLLGEFRPADYVVQAGISREYAQKWKYGASLKFIYSSYGIYRSSGVAMDLGLTYTDTSSLFQAALVLKNMGTQLKAYDGSSRQDLPFDIQVGLSKRLAKAPLQFSLTLHHLHQFNIRYEDTVFNADNGFTQTGQAFFDQLFRHIVFSAQFFVSNKIEISAGYNYLRRQELNIGNAGNGLNGFSMGVGILVKKLQLRYARTYFQANQVSNQLGIGFSLSSLSSNHNK